MAADDSTTSDQAGFEGSAPRALPLLWEGGTIPVVELVRLPPGTRAEEVLVLWVESDTERVVGARFVDASVRAGATGELLMKAIRQPLAGPPRQPAEVRVRNLDLAREVRPYVDPLGIRVTIAECQAWDTVVSEFGAFLAAHWPGRSYLGGAGVTAECVEQFFDAAAAFYRHAPWEVLAERPIEIRLAEHRDPLYAVVMGSSRVVHGLTLHFSGSALAQLQASDEHPVRTRDTVALTFDREDGIPPPMLEERKTHRWALAGPAAFPLPYRQLADGTMREPDAAELGLLTVALLAVAEFVRRRQPLADGRGTGTVEEAVLVHGAAGDSIARLTFPARLPDSANGDRPASPAS